MSGQGKGTWIPEDVIKTWESLRLNPPTWNVLMVLAHQQYRYGGVEARITLTAVAKRINRSLSTVKRSICRLRNEKLLIKLGRGRWRIGVNMMTPPERQDVNNMGVNIAAPLKAHDRGPFPILLLSLLEKEDDSGSVPPFTVGQIKMINSVVCQISELLCGKDALALTVSKDETKTYGDWLRTIVSANNRKEAGIFVSSMLKLLNDERVAGRELT